MLEKVDPSQSNHVPVLVLGCLFDGHAITVPIGRLELTLPWEGSLIFYAGQKSNISWTCFITSRG